MYFIFALDIHVGSFETTSVAPLLGKSCSPGSTNELVVEPAHDVMDLSHRRPAKAQASLCIPAVSPEPLLFAHIKYGNKRRVQPKTRHVVPLDGCQCAFEE